MHAPANAPPELMQLGEPEPLRVLDQHHGGVRDIDAHLDHGCGDKNPDFARRERLHHTVFLLRFHPAVQHADLQSPELLCQCSRLHCHAGEFEFLGLLDHRADHICLTPRLRLPVDEPERIRSPAGIHDRAANRKPSGRPLVQNRNIQIAVENHTQRTGNRCRAHHQCVRHIPFLRKRLSLPYAEAVLLIRDHQGQTVVQDPVLDQRMCSDDELRCAFFDRLQRLPPVRYAHRARQKNRMKSVEFHPVKQPAELLEVLPRQHFRRRHQRRLHTVRRCLQHGKKRKNCFAGSHIALNKTVHQPVRSQIRFDLPPDPFLRAGQRIRKRVDHFLGDPDRRNGKRTAAVLFLALQSAERYHGQEKLIEDKSLPCPEKLLSVMRKMDAPNRLLLVLKA